MSSTKFKIALIDDMIECRTSNEVDVEQINLIDTKKVGTHGTHNFKLIANTYTHFKLINIIVLNENLEGDIRKLYIALDWCLKNNVKVINISLGTTRISDYYILEDVIKKLNDNGVIIISANSNAGLFSYPASMEQVLSVRQSHKRLVRYSPVTGFEIQVDKKFEYLGNMLSSGANSFACAYITGIIAGMLLKEEITNLNDIVNTLISDYEFNFDEEKVEKKIEVPIIMIESNIIKKIDVVEFYNVCNKNLYNSIMISDDGLIDAVKGLFRLNKEIDLYSNVLNKMDLSFILLVKKDTTECTYPTISIEQIYSPQDLLDEILRI